MNWTLGCGPKFSYTHERHIGATLENQYTSVVMTPLVVPKVSILYRFHCTPILHGQSVLYSACIPVCAVFPMYPYVCCIPHVSPCVLYSPCIPVCAVFPMYPRVCCIPHVSQCVLYSPCIPVCAVFPMYPRVCCIPHVSQCVLYSPCIPVCAVLFLFLSLIVYKTRDQLSPSLFSCR